MSISSSPTQTVSASAVSGTSMVLTIANPVVGANLFVVASSTGTTPTVTSITGGGVTWDVAPAISHATNRYCVIWQGVNSSGSGTTITVNFSGTIAASIVWVLEFSGVAIASSLDSTGVGSGTSTTPSAALSPDPVGGLEELILYVQRRGGAFVSGPTNGFTRVTQGSANGAGLAAYQVVANTSGSYSTGFTVDSSGTWDAVIASFKAASVAGSIPNRAVSLNQAVNRASRY